MKYSPIERARKTVKIQRLLRQNYSESAACKLAGIRPLTWRSWKHKASAQETQPKRKYTKRAKPQVTDAGFAVEVRIPDFVLQNAVKTYLANKLGLKLVEV